MFPVWPSMVFGLTCNNTARGNHGHAAGDAAGGRGRVGEEQGPQEEAGGRRGPFDHRVHGDVEAREGAQSEHRVDGVEEGGQGEGQTPTGI